MPANGAERILRLKSVLERSGLTRSTLSRKMRLGTFPKQLPEPDATAAQEP